VKQFTQNESTSKQQPNFTKNYIFSKIGFFLDFYFVVHGLLSANLLALNFKLGIFRQLLLAKKWPIGQMDKKNRQALYRNCMCCSKFDKFW
jgi:hypothetical protein